MAYQQNTGQSLGSVRGGATNGAPRAPPASVGGSMTWSGTKPDTNGPTTHIVEHDDPTVLTPTHPPTGEPGTMTVVGLGPEPLEKPPLEEVIIPPHETYDSREEALLLMGDPKDMLAAPTGYGGTKYRPPSLEHEVSVGNIRTGTVPPELDPALNPPKYTFPTHGMTPWEVEVEAERRRRQGQDPEFRPRTAQEEAGSLTPWLFAVAGVALAAFLL